MLNRSSFLTVLVCMLLCTAVPLLAQNAPGQGQGQGQGQGGFGGQGQGGRGGRGNFDPAARAAQQLDDIKIALAASDEEWQVLRPKIEKLIAANAEVQSGNGRGGGGGGGRRGGGQGGPQGVAGGRGGQGADTAVSRALAELRTTLENPNAPAEQITQKLMALRDARVKSRANLDIARKDVKDLLTARQEAVLVASYGLLE